MEISSDYQLMLAENAVVDAYENLSVKEKELDSVRSIMLNLSEAAESLGVVSNLGEYGGVMNIDGGLKELFSVEELKGEIGRPALENKFTEAISEGFKKFLEKVVELAKAIKEWLEKVFNTTSYKIREILQNGVERLNFEKPASLITKDSYTKVGAAVIDLNNIVKEHVKLPSMSDPFIRGPQNGIQLLQKLAMAHNEVLVVNNLTVKVEGKATEFAQMTLNDTKFSVGDIIKISYAYGNRTKEFSAMSDFFHIMKDKLLEGSILSQNGGDAVPIVRGIIAMDISCYSALTKLHAITARLISGFFKCLDDRSVTIKEQNYGNQLQYTP